MNTFPYLLTPDKVLLKFSSSLSGLSEAEVKKRIEEHGLNQIETKQKTNTFKLILDQLLNPIVILLLVAVILSFLTGKYFEASLIGGIVIFMACIGVYLESKANSAVDKLKQLVKQDSTVIRDGRQITVESSQLVPGDILFLQEGDKVTADARVIYSNLGSIDESILTGESLPINKITEKLNNEVLIADQKNMVFSGTFVVQGNLKAVVTATGIKTELGKITLKLSEVEEKPTPLQIQLIKLSQTLSFATLALCSVILILSTVRGQSFIEGLTQSLSLAIAFIPEGLSAVMTVVLALGVRDMVKKNVIVKRLLAAEGLGSINILATDKTGTITTGQMNVEKLWMFSKEINIKNFSPTTRIEQKILDIIKFCNNKNGATELALLKFLEKFNFEFELQERSQEFAFSSSLKRMSTIYKNNETFNLFSKGAPEILVQLSSYYFDEKTDKVIEIGEKEKRLITQQFENLAKQGYRVLALAYKDLPLNTNISKREEVEKDLVFVGLIGLIDPLRDDVKETVQTLRNASISAIMITGDHPEIAKTIAYEAGIVETKDSKVINGTELQEFTSGHSNITEKDILNCRIFARVTPEQKEILINTYKSNGFQIAMAGDGINDVVAISRSSIGIGVLNAMDIVKEAADVIITGSYSALANAVEMGRLVMFRTRLYLHYLLSGNLCQVGIFILALIFNLPFPLTAIQLLTINLLTDAAPAMAMAFEKGSKNIMNQPPKPPKESIINSYIWRSISLQGFASSAFLFAIFTLTLPNGLILAQTATFTGYIFQKLFRALTARSFDESILEYGFFTNRAIILSIILGFLVWFGIVFISPEIFGMQIINPTLVLNIAVFALLMPVLEEILKFLNRKTTPIS